MTIVRNYSDLSPAMRDALTTINNGGTVKRTTGDALVRRDLAIYAGSDYYKLTEAGERARTRIVADVPAKVAYYLDRARELGLTVERSEDAGSLKSWTIASPNPIDNSQVWLYWGPGARGGRLGFTLYYGPNTKTRRNAPLRYINYTMQTMSESLQRHHEREAARLVEQRAATAERMAECQAALAEVFAELDGAEIPGEQETRAAEQQQLTVTQWRGRKNLLHEELNLSTVHANDGTGFPLCRPDGVLPSDTTEVIFLVDCQVCLFKINAPATHPGRLTMPDPHGPDAVYDASGKWVAGPPVPEPVRTLECGCPARIVADEGHQEGCVHHSIDPSRPGWFMVGQYIYDHQADVHASVTGVTLGSDGRVSAVAVSLNGGYGDTWRWYGDHPESVGPIQLLEGPHVGLGDSELRSWPQRRAAIGRVRNVLTDQCLSGWPAAGEDRAGYYVLVNIPRGVDPERHRVLLSRYMPYPATVEIRRSQAGQVGDAIIIRPRED